MFKGLKAFLLFLTISAIVIITVTLFQSSNKVEQSSDNLAQEIFDNNDLEKIELAKKNEIEKNLNDDLQSENEDFIESKEEKNQELERIQNSINFDNNVEDEILENQEIKEGESILVVAEQDKEQEDIYKKTDSNSINNQDLFLLSQDDINQLSRSSNDYNSNSNINSNRALPSSATGLIGGVVTRSFKREVFEEIAPEEITEEQPDEQLPETLPAVSGQARGYTMLYLMHPLARRTVEAQVEALLVSGLQELYLAVLTDGTFNKDFTYLSNVVRRLNSNGRTLTLVLYLSNGSTMRAFRTTNINAGFNKIDPIRFRDLIRFDPAIQNQFRGMVREAKPIFDLNKSLNPNNTNIAIVMLEDNLREESYIAMRNIAKEILGDSVRYFRNPCANCYEGNDTETDGDNKEFHNPFLIEQLGDGDGYSNDGTSYFFQGEDLGQNSVSIADLKSFSEVALVRNLKYFGIWRLQRQGLTLSGPRPHPDQRNYEYPSIQMLIEEIKLLRYGLK